MREFMQHTVMKNLIFINKVLEKIIKFLDGFIVIIFIFSKNWNLERRNWIVKHRRKVLLDIHT